MSSQASQHKIGSWPSKWKLEFSNERLIFTAGDKDNEAFTIKQSDIDLIDNQKAGRLYNEIRIISKHDKIYTIKKVPSSDAEKAVQWIQDTTNPHKEWKQDQEWSETRISTGAKKELTAKESVQWYNTILWIIAVILVILWTNLWGFRSILTLAPCYAIRARETVATKDQKTLDRIKNRKNHTVRLLSSSVWWLIAVMLVIGALTEQANPTPTPQPVIEKQLTPEEQAKIDADKKAEAERIAKENLAEDQRENPEKYIEVTQNKREMDWFGTVAVHSITLKNNSQFDYKDITLKATYYSSSETQLDSSNQTIYEILPAGATKTFKNINFWFAHSQSKSSVVTIKSASIK